jgi:hypothetical protein
MTWLSRTKLLSIASTALLAIVCAIHGASVLAQQPPPATQAGGGWFDGGFKITPTTLPSGTSIDEPTLFARLYPELARADKAVRAATPRIVFDALDSKNKPLLKLPRIDVCYQTFTDASWRAFEVGRRKEPFLQVPDERKVRIATIDAKRKGASLCLDIETLPLDVRFSSVDEIDRSVRILAQAAGFVRAQDPNVRLFLYGGTPAGDSYIGYQIAGAATTRPDGANFRWWKDNQPKWQGDYEAWQRANALLRRAPEPGAHEAAASLGGLFDGVCPSLYLVFEPTRPTSTEGIVPWVRSHIDEARRYGKPVYPFVSFYASDRHVVTLAQWTMMIREIVTHADGVVLWDGPNPWDERMSLRTRAATLLAERKGTMNDDELFAALRKEFPGDAELKAIAASSTTQPTTQQSP